MSCLFKVRSVAVTVDVQLIWDQQRNEECYKSVSQHPADGSGVRINPETNTGSAILMCMCMYVHACVRVCMCVDLCAFYNIRDVRAELERQ